jgi:phosphoglucomutase
MSPLAGKPADPAALVDIPRLITAYFAQCPDPAIATQRVSFGTSGHRGCAFDTSFNEAHILAITQAICLYRQKEGIDGPLFVGKDTHALSEPAFVSAIEVLAANGAEFMLDDKDGYTPTPAVSHAILTYNKGRTTGLADGIVITPSHNPPKDGGFKYNPPHGGPASSEVTGWIERTANDFLHAKLEGVRRIGLAQALKSPCAHRHDYIGHYVRDLASVVDMEVIRSVGVTIGIDPLGGAGVQYWPVIAEQYGLNATVVNAAIDPTFRFMTLDWDGQIRMDCSSPYAMAPLIAMRERFDVAFANDTDADRHGIVCPSSGLMNPNHYLTAAIGYLFTHRPGWGAGCAVGKTIVSSSSIDRVTAKLGRALIEVPVGFKWFVDGLVGGRMGFAGEESAGASFLRRDGSVWTTDKDGLILGLLAAEMTARTGRDPGEIYAAHAAEFGAPVYERIDAPASADQRRRLLALTPEKMPADTLAGEKVTAKLTKAPGNGQGIGGIKVIAEHGWFAARPSGTEDVYKLYAESFRSAEHLREIQADAKKAIAKVFEAPA